MRMSDEDLLAEWSLWNSMAQGFSDEEAVGRRAELETEMARRRILPPRFLKSRNKK